MAKFVIECPNCGKYAEAKSGFFARKKIDCACGYTINVRTDKLSSRVCAHCGNNVVYDQSKGEKAKCPVCGEPINTLADRDKFVEFHCAQCGISLRAARGAQQFTCPVCDRVNNVVERAKSEEIKKEGLASIIKYEGDTETLVWKHPIEDFNYGSQLIVHESQEAIFFRDGQALDLFGPGRYALETNQLPIMEKFYKLPADSQQVFHSEVYFVNKVVQMAVKWGTPERVRFIDPLTGAPLELGASGELNLQVSDSRRLLVKLVGTMKGIAWDSGENMAKSLQASFRPLISNAVKVNLADVIKENSIDILEVDENLDLISDRLRDKISAGFEEYGLTIPQLYVTNVLLPENDPNFKLIREMHTFALQSRIIQGRATVEAVEQQSKATVEAARRGFVLEQQATETEVAKRAAEREVIKAEAAAQANRLAGLSEADVMRAKGYNQKDEIQAGVQKAYAEAIGNMGPDTVNGGGGGAGGGMMSDMLGLGMGMAAMNSIAPQLGNMMQGFAGLNQAAAPAAPEAPKPEGWTCASCGASGITSKFCPECGAPKPSVKPAADAWDCPACGCKGITSKFCPECGAKKPEAPEAWDCPACGCKGITSKFCPECGAKKPEAPAAWDCPDCGKVGITSNFCPNCGKKKDE